MDYLANLANSFIGIFQAGGEVFVNYLTNIVPTLVCLITCINAIVNVVGKDKVNKFGQFCGKNIILRYTLLPFLSLFFFTSPICFTMGQFLEEKYKPAFYDATVSFVHPILGIFPHANAGEYFVYFGIASGITKLGLELGSLAVRYFLVGLIVILIRGILCELLTKRFLEKNNG